MAREAGKSRRGFELHTEADPDRSDGRYGIAIIQTNGTADNRRTVVRLPPDRLEAAHPALTEALRTSGHARTALKPTRATPLPLEEESGVRLALALAAIIGVSKPGRTTRILDGVSRLSTEECFYWYAHTLGASDRSVMRRRLKAFRLFLAGE